MSWLLLSCAGLADRDNPLDAHYQGPRGGLKGRVVLKSGKALKISETTGKAAVNYSGVTVSMERLPSFTTTSTQNGDFSLGRIPVGTWKFIVSAPGYVTSTVSAGIRKNEETVLPDISVDELVAGKLVFGSSREGFPTLYQTDAAGSAFTSLSHLPIQSNYCRYAEWKDKKVLVVQSDFMVYDDHGAYKTDSGFIVSEFPSLKPINFVHAGSEIQRPALAPDGKLVFGLNIGGDAFLGSIAPGDKPGSNAEAYRITGSPNDGWKESSPAVSPSGKIAYIRIGQDSGSDSPMYEIRVLDGSPGPGKLVHQRSLVNLALQLAKKKKFDFDSDGEDDLLKFITVFSQHPNQLILTPGIDWSAPITSDVQAFLEGPQPDGIVLDAYQLILEMIQLGAMWDLVWLPDDQTLVFVDRMFSNPGGHFSYLWPIRKNGSYVTDFNASVLREPTSGRATLYYFDIDQNGSYSAAVDKPFWYESPANYIKAMDVTVNRIEIQSLRKVRQDNPDPLAEAEPFFNADPEQWIFSPSASPDGKRVSLAIGPTEALVAGVDVASIMTQGNIVTVDPENGFVTRITSDGFNNRAPCWVP